MKILILGAGQVGSSAAYVMVAGFWSTIVGNLLAKLTPGLVRDWAQPGLDASEQRIVSVPIEASRLRVWSGGRWESVEGEVRCTVEGLFDPFDVALPAAR